MGIGAADEDTIAAGECSVLRQAASEIFPAHRFHVEADAEGRLWVVIEPPARRADLLRFTICRIAPCVMVLVEDGAGRRQICSTSDVDGALAYARDAADQAVLAAMNAHPARHVVQ